jgi:hypothetical protein
VQTKVRCLCSSTMLNDNMIKVAYPFFSFHSRGTHYMQLFLWLQPVSFGVMSLVNLYLASCFLQCEDAKCQVWQHMTCVLIPDRPTEGVSPEVPPHFYCELCRLNRADPYVLLWLVWFTLFPFYFSRELLRCPAIAKM